MAGRKRKKMGGGPSGGATASVRGMKPVGKGKGGGPSRPPSKMRTGRKKG